MTTILEDYQSGMRIKDIELKHHYANIYDHIPKNVRRKNRLLEFREQIKDEYLQGMTIEELTQKYNISRASVRYILKGYDIEIRKVRKVE
jgi:Mor family transcriptional regulator